MVSDKKKSLDFRLRFLNINYRHFIRDTLIFRFRPKLTIFRELRVTLSEYQNFK